MNPPCQAVVRMTVSTSRQAAEGQPLPNSLTRMLLGMAPRPRRKGLWRLRRSLPGLQVHCHTSPAAAKHPHPQPRLLLASHQPGPPAQRAREWRGSSQQKRHFHRREVSPLRKAGSQASPPTTPSHPQNKQTSHQVRNLTWTWASSRQSPVFPGRHSHPHRPVLSASPLLPDYTWKTDPARPALSLTDAGRRACGRQQG